MRTLNFVSSLHTNFLTPIPERDISAALPPFLFDNLIIATPNDTTPLNTRIQQAKDWLKEHENKSVATVLHIFKIAKTILHSSIKCTPQGPRGARIKSLIQIKRRILIGLFNPIWITLFCLLKACF
jgi:hypothetical protein